MTATKDGDSGMDRLYVGLAFSQPRPRSEAFQINSPAAYSLMTAPRSIVLIGMMGAGKSSVGRCLERRTGLRRFDTDEIVSRHFGKSVSEIFAKLGEEQFRQAETKALAGLTPDPPAIIVTGGGIVLKEENIQHLKRLGRVVWLDAEEEILFERATRRGNRPLLKTDDPRATLAKIRAERETRYAEASDVRINTGGRSHEEVADMILTEIDRTTAGDLEIERDR